MGPSSGPPLSAGMASVAAVSAIPDSEFAGEQLKCADCASLASSPRFAVRPAGGGVLVSYASDTPRLLVPAIYRRRVFEEAHSPAHPGVRATRRLVARRFLWPGMRRDVGEWTAACIQCQTAKIHRHQRAPVEEIPVPVRRFSHLHVDLVGPLHSSSNFTHILTIVDRSTRWPEAIPLTDTSTSSCILALNTAWISRFGVPSTITTDQGSQFMSTAWSSYCREMGVEHIHTTAYHPQSNGMVERLHRRLKNALRARRAVSTWSSDLPLVMLCLRTSPMEGSGLSSAEMVYGSALSLPSSFLDARHPPDSAFTRRLQAATAGLLPPPTNVPPGPVYLDSRLQTAAFVFVRRDGHVPPLQPLYAGPYAVLWRTAKCFVLRVGDKEVTVSVDRLKPAITDGAVQVAVPPRRGRPRKSPSAPAPASTTSPPPARRRRGRPPCPAPSSTPSSGCAATRRQPPRRCTRGGAVAPPTRR